MALTRNPRVANRVKETSTTTGTGTLDLDGAATGFQTFVAGAGNGVTCYYVIEDGVDWETGIGTVTNASPDTLSRTTITGSSNGGAAVNWAAGTRDVFIDLIADEGNESMKAFDIAYDADVSMSIGRSAIGGITSSAYWGNLATYGTLDYAIKQSGIGTTTLNSGFTQALLFSIDNTERMRLNTAGLGIGGTPINKLGVFGGAVVGANYAGVQTAPTDGLLVEGNVGIGKTGPTAKLHAANGSSGGSSAAAAVITAESNSNASLQILTPNSSSGSFLFGDPESANVGRVSYAHNTDTLSFWQNGNQRLTITSSGLVGIGTTAPLNRLGVAGACAIGSSYAGVNTAPANGLLVEGNVGIGRTATTYRLDVANTATTVVARIAGSSSGSFIRFETDSTVRGSIGALGTTGVGLLNAAGGVRVLLNSATDYLGIRAGGTPAATTLATLTEDKLITTSPADDYAAAITIDSDYNASSAQTVTRHNYIDVQNVLGGANVTITNACVMRFNAAAGTHKAIDAGGATTNIGTTSGWLKINVNGTIHYIPTYTTKNP